MGPPLPRAPLGIRLFGSTDAKLVLELFFDLNCPYSAKMFRCVRELPRALAEKAPTASLSMIVHLVPQPWHPQSCIQNEAVLAVQAVKPELAVAFMNRVFDAESEFKDVPTWDLSRAQMVDKLVGYAGELGVNTAALKTALTPEGGGQTPTTQAVKFAVKYHRARSIHVTPTVLLNGLEASDISSSWTLDQWVERLAPLVAE